MSGVLPPGQGREDGAEGDVRGTGTHDGPSRRGPEARTHRDTETGTRGGTPVGG